MSVIIASNHERAYHTKEHTSLIEEYHIATSLCYFIAQSLNK